MGQRKVFGNKLVEQPVIREKLAQMFANVESCTSMLYDVTHNMNVVGTQSPEIGGRGVTSGGMGRVIDTFHRVYKVPSVYGGSEEIMADLAVRQAIKSYPATARL